MPLLSIITVNYNNNDGLKKTIDSIVHQTLQDFEYIIVDGGSTDGSLATIQQFSIRWRSTVQPFKWLSEPDDGIYQAMNKGIGLATGDYCLFLNSGDSLADKYVLEDVFKLPGNEAIIYGNSFKVKPHYRRTIRYSDRLTLYDFYRMIPALHHQASFIRRELFLQYGFYREDLSINADWEFFFKVIILNKVKTRYMDRTICVFDGKGLSNSLRKDQPEAINAFEAKKNILNENFPDYVLTDYKKLDEFLSHPSQWQKMLNRIAYFSFRK